MNIRIAERLRPFSFIPGATCLIPGTVVPIEVFPTLLRFGKWEVKLNLSGPVEGFMVQQSLEEHCVFVSGKAKEGFIRLRIEGNDLGFTLFADRVPTGGLMTSAGLIERKGILDFPQEIEFVHSTRFERLSLGSHKAQNWEDIQKRADLSELLPLLFCLGQKIPFIPPQPLTGTARLLHSTFERQALPKALLNFFKAAFKGILVPRLYDDQYQGLCPDEPVTGNPSFLIQEGAKWVRSLFFHQNERRLSFLPNLPIPLHSGRLLHGIAEGIGEFDFEWSKKILKRVVLRASNTGDVVLILQKGLESFRIRKSMNEKGNRVNAGEPLLLEDGKTYFLDRFQK
jgi:hypothetical protein